MSYIRTRSLTSIIQDERLVIFLVELLSGLRFSGRVVSTYYLVIALFFGKSKKSYFSDCPEDWVDLGPRHGCFYFATEAGNMDWFEALDYCNNLHENAFLAEIRTKPTQELIVEYADTIPDHGWWLGGADFFGVFLLILW